MISNKAELRIKAKKIRKTLDIPKISSVLTEKIRNHNFYQKAQHVMLFYPLINEPNFLSLLSDDKIFYFPKVNGRELLVCPYTKETELKKSSFGIFEPCSEPYPPEYLDLVVVPALMADKKGYRLGYGGGFYDRFLPKIKAKTICAVPEKLYADKLPSDEFDIPVDVVITDF